MHLLAHRSRGCSFSISVLMTSNFINRASSDISFRFISSWNPEIDMLRCALRTTILTVILGVSTLSSPTFIVILNFSNRVFRNIFTSISFSIFFNFFCSFHHHSLGTIAVPVESCCIRFSPNCPGFGGPVLGFRPPRKSRRSPSWSLTSDTVGPFPVTPCCCECCCWFATTLITSAWT